MTESHFSMKNIIYNPNSSFCEEKIMKNMLKKLLQHIFDVSNIFFWTPEHFSNLRLKFFETHVKVLTLSPVLTLFKFSFFYEKKMPCYSQVNFLTILTRFLNRKKSLGFWVYLQITLFSDSPKTNNISTFWLCFSKTKNENIIVNWWFNYWQIWLGHSSSQESLLNCRKCMLLKENDWWRHNYNLKAEKIQQKPKMTHI